MNTLAVQDLLQIQQDLQVLKTTVSQLQQRLNTLLNQVQPTPQTDSRPPLAQLRGLWQGHEWSLGEIQAVEYQGVGNL